MARKKKSGVQAEGQPLPDASPTADQLAERREEQTSAQPALADVPARAKRFPIVGVGASAGGLAAFEAFLSAMPSDVEVGMAFVLVQHLAPDHKSILSELVRRYTRMQVFEVKDGMQVQAGCTYIIPPNRDMALLNGTLHLLEPAAPRGLRLPIDFFFRSLAQDQHERAICIVLSGTGSDGTLGVRAVKGEGGMVMVQAPTSTQYDGMPQSAIATGMVDYILPPEEMPAQLLAYVSHAFSVSLAPAVARSTKVDETLRKICVVLRAQTGHDFSQYKKNTVIRRVERRMALHQLEQPDDYLRFLQSNGAEVHALFSDLLIGVTSFFRDPSAFDALQSEILPKLMVDKSAGATIRVWVCGCSTGEEAYSIAILFQEYLERSALYYKVQIFATDIDSRAVNQARTGIFPASIATDITPERLARFFALEPDSAFYRVRKSIRDMLIFSEQDVIKDPPFSRVDLISCRNLLIYMDTELQRKVLALFHYGLNRNGVLFLGTSETVGDQTALYSALDYKWKIFARRQEGTDVARFAFAVPPARRAEYPEHGTPATAGKQPEIHQTMRNLTEQSLLAHYAQAAVLVNRQGDVRYIYGRTGKYLEPAPGDASANILTMAREGLRRELTTALHQAATRGEVVSRHGLRVRTNGDAITANLTVQPVISTEETLTLDLFLVVLEEVPQIAAGSETLVAEAARGASSDDTLRIAALEMDLRAKEEYLQTALEEMESSNEELRSTNEEMQSVNEELQSTNEELETSKEELQSVNEELATVNAELQAKVVDLSRVNNDMNNLLAGTGIATLFVDPQLHIARFTPAAVNVINLIESDVGRPIGHLVANFVGYESLVDDINAVLESLSPREAEVKTKAGAWYLMRIRPYRTLENVIEGAVVTFVDITARRRAEAIINAQLAEITSYYDNAPIGLAVLDNELRFVRINHHLAAIYGRAAGALLGKAIEEVAPDLAEQAKRTAATIRATNEPVVDFRIVGETTAQPGIQRAWRAGWYPLRDNENNINGFSIIVREISGDSPPPSPTGRQT